MNQTPIQILSVQLFKLEVGVRFNIIINYTSIRDNIDLCFGNFFTYVSILYWYHIDLYSYLFNNVDLKTIKTKGTVT